MALRNAGVQRAKTDWTSSLLDFSKCVVVLLVVDTFGINDIWHASIILIA